MTKLLKVSLIAAFFMPTMVLANNTSTAVQASAEKGKVTVVSPRTGIQYSIENPKNLPITLQTEAISAANSATVDRIVASNPALSVESQQNAKKALLNMK